MDRFLTHVVLTALLSACVGVGVCAERRDASPHAVYIRPSVVQPRADVGVSGTSHSAGSADASSAVEESVHLDEIGYSTYLKIALHDRHLDDEELEEDDDDDTAVKAIAHRPVWTMNRSEERVKCLLKRARDRLKMYVEENDSDFTVATSYLLRNAIRVMNDASFLINDDEACHMDGRPHYRSPLATPSPPVTVTYYVCTTTPGEVATPSDVATPATSATYCSVTTQTRCPDTMTTNCPVRTTTVCPESAPASWPSYPMPTTTLPTPIIATTTALGDAVKPYCRVTAQTRCADTMTTNCPVKFRTICARPTTTTPATVIVPTTTSLDDVTPTSASCSLTTQTRCPDTMTTDCPIRVKTVCATAVPTSVSSVAKIPQSIASSVFVSPTLGDVQEALCKVTTQTRCPDTMTTNCPVRVKTVCESVPTFAPTISFVDVVPTATVGPDSGCSITTSTRCPDTLRSDCPVVTRTVCPGMDDAVPLATTTRPSASASAECWVTTKTRCPDTMTVGCPVRTHTVCSDVTVATPTPTPTPTPTQATATAVGEDGQHCAVTTQTRCPDTMTTNCPTRTKTVCSPRPIAPSVQFNPMVIAAPDGVAATDCKVTTKTRCPDTMTTNCPIKTTTICATNQADVIASITTTTTPTTTVPSLLETIGFWFQPPDKPHCTYTTQSRCPDTQTTNCPVQIKTVCSTPSTPSTSSTQARPSVVPTAVAVDAAGCHVTTQTRCPDTMTTNCPERTKTVCPVGATPGTPVVDDVAATQTPSCSISTQFVCMHGLTTNCPYIQHTVCATSASMVATTTAAPGQCHFSTEYVCPDQATTNCPYIQHEVCAPATDARPPPSAPSSTYHDDWTTVAAPAASSSVHLEPSIPAEPSIAPKPPVFFEPWTAPLAIASTFSFTVAPSPPKPPAAKPSVSAILSVDPVVTLPPLAAPSNVPEHSIPFEPSNVPEPSIPFEPSNVPEPSIPIEPSNVPEPSIPAKPSIAPKPSVLFEPSTAPLAIASSLFSFAPSRPKPSADKPPVSPSLPPLAAPAQTSTQAPATPIASTVAPVQDATQCSVVTKTRCADTQTASCPTRVITVCSTTATTASSIKPLADPQPSRPPHRPSSNRPHVSVDVTVQVGRPSPGPRPPRPPIRPRPPVDGEEPDAQPPAVTPNRLAALAQRVDKLIEQIRLLILKLRTDLQTGQLRSQYHYDAIQQPLEEIKQLQKLLNHPKELTKELTKFTYQQSLKLERDLKKQQISLKKLLNDPEGVTSPSSPSSDATELTEQLQRLQASLQQLKPAPAVAFKKNTKPARGR